MKRQYFELVVYTDEVPDDFDGDPRELIPDLIDFALADVGLHPMLITPIDVEDGN